MRQDVSTNRVAWRPTSRSGLQSRPTVEVPPGYVPCSNSGGAMSRPNN